MIGTNSLQLYSDTYNIFLQINEIERNLLILLLRDIKNKVQTKPDDKITQASIWTFKKRVCPIVSHDNLKYALYYLE